MSVLYVSPTGQDSHEGTGKFPFKTITHALTQARPGDIVQLASSTYQTEEKFPLVVPDGVTVAGTTAASVIVRGGGSYQLAGAPAGDSVNGTSVNGTSVNVTMVLGDRAQIREVTVTNPQGSGLLSIAGAALIIRNRLVQSQQHGALIAGIAHPFISQNEFIENGATGLTLRSQAKGEIRQNRFQQTGTGISLFDQSAPLIVDNQLTENHTGVLVAHSARPVFRQNQLLANQEIGLWTKDRAQPDIGQPQDLGANHFEGKTYDICNDAASPVVTAGNQLNPIRTKGAIAYLPSEIPDDAAVPAVLLGTVEPLPELRIRPMRRVPLRPLAPTCPA